MTLLECVKIGHECGLTSIEECYDNAARHYDSLFKIEETGKELEELQKDIFYHHPDEFCKIFKAEKEDLLAKGWKTKKYEK